MDHFREYMAAEVALDHAAGQINRREALRQLGVMGLPLPAASAVLAACGKDKKDATAGQTATTAAGTGATTASTAAGPATTRAATTPVPTQEVTYPGPNGTVFGAYAPAASAKGPVVVVHENRGL